MQMILLEDLLQDDMLSPPSEPGENDTDPCEACPAPPESPFSESVKQVKVRWGFGETVYTGEHWWALCALLRFPCHGGDSECWLSSCSQTGSALVL